MYDVFSDFAKRKKIQKMIWFEIQSNCDDDDEIFWNCLKFAELNDNDYIDVNVDVVKISNIWNDERDVLNRRSTDRKFPKIDFIKSELVFNSTIKNEFILNDTMHCI